MIGKLTEILKNSGADGWELEERRTDGWEFYFIRNKLDQNRARKITDYRIKVYKFIGDREWFGSAAAVVSPDETEEELKKTVENLCFQASLVKNKPYRLHQPSKTAPASGEKADISDIASDFITTMHEIPQTETEDINSYEIFVSDNERRLITSEGIDVTENWPSSMCEVVVNARQKDHEIELYRMYEGGTCGRETLQEDLQRTMRFGRDRLSARSTPVMPDTPVVFSTRDSVTLFRYFLTRLGTTAVYQNISDWQIGKPIAEGITGDQVNVRSIRHLPNSSANHVYDEEGALIRDEVLMENSIPRCLWGDRMTSQYLEKEDAFIVSNVVFDGGTAEEDEIRSGRYLEIVEFSDFQTDAVTGSIFGEIRLAYYHDNGAVTPVTGGSVSGSMKDFVKNMRMSRTMKQYDRFLVPALTRLENVTITGVAEGEKE